MNTTDLGYISGFLDGDGCIHFTKNYGYLILIWYSPCYKAIKRIKDAIGYGSIYEEKPRRPNRKVTMYRLSIFGTKAEKLYYELKEFLVSKGAKVTLPYIAGFFDAEGCVERSKRLDLRVVKITNTNLFILTQIQRLVGFGRIYRRGGQQKNCYDLRVCHQDQVKRFSELLIHHVIIKREKLLEALEHSAKREIKNIHKLRDVPREELRVLYITKKFSISKIASLYGVDSSSIHNKLRKIKIPIRTRSDACKIRNVYYGYQRNDRGRFIGKY